MGDVKKPRAAASAAPSVYQVRVVLVRPKSAGNVGAVARAMKNFGVVDLALVAPRRWRGGAAQTMAVHAADLLAGRTEHASLAGAVADCAWVVGTTCRPGSYRGRALNPRAAGAKIAALAATNRVALVFGPEDHGLSNEDLKLCQQLITIPTHSAYPSLNLAQAVLVTLYEIFLAGHPPADREPALASSARLERMYEHLGAALLRIGFLHGDNPEHIMFTLRRLFGRAHLDEREVAIWLGVARQIEWFAGAGREVAESKRKRGARVK